MHRINLKVWNTGNSTCLFTAEPHPEQSVNLGPKGR